MLKIQLLHNQGCPFWQEVEKVLKEVLLEKGRKEEPEVVIVRNEEEAAKHHFFGSPQLTINGQDIDPQAQHVKNFHLTGCRIYLWEGKVWDYPPKGTIEQALEQARQKLIEKGQ